MTESNHTKIEYPAITEEFSGGWLRLLRVFGPGAIIASVTVGTGETIFAPRAGATFGYALFWVIVVAVLGKAVMVYAGARSYTASDNCGPVDTSLNISSNEPVNGEGDGDTVTDWEVLDTHHVRLRAERSGRGVGRIYTITITAVDSRGNTSTETVSVSVPLN